MLQGIRMIEKEFLNLNKGDKVKNKLTNEVGKVIFKNLAKNSVAINMNGSGITLDYKVLETVKD